MSSIIKKFKWDNGIIKTTAGGLEKELDFTLM